MLTTSKDAPAIRLPARDKERDYELELSMQMPANLPESELSDSTE